MLEDNFRRVRALISEAAARVGRHPGDIRLIAVTKTVDADTACRAAGLGMEDFGENRVQDAAEKISCLGGVRWHFIGHLQSNKARFVVPAYWLIHSLDRLSLARELQRWADHFKRDVSALIQVNVSGESSKYGIAPGDLTAFIGSLREFDRIRVLGLMTMAPLTGDPEEARSIFRQLRLLRDKNARPGLELGELSMGMSNDYIVAVEEGATMVRIGSAIFG